VQEGRTRVSRLKRAQGSGVARAKRGPENVEAWGEKRRIFCETRMGGYKIPAPVGALASIIRRQNPAAS
jgi:hypothetical protein